MDSIVLSQKTVTNLIKVNDLLEDSDGLERLKLICKYILQIVVAGKTNIIIDARDDDILSSISIIIFEAAKIQATSSQLSSTLHEHNINETVKDMITTLYDQHNESFIQHLSLVGITMPSIVGVEWRLDYVVRSKHGGRENFPLFLVSLQVKDRGLVRYVDFTATNEELQDLLSKVRDAVKQVDRELTVDK